MTYSTEGSIATSKANSNISEASKDTVNVKIQFKGDIRRFVLTGTPTIASLRARVLAMFSIPVDAPIVLLYRDDENDLVTISLDEELRHALQVSRGLLRLQVRIAGEPQAPQPDQGEFSRFSHDAKPWRKMWKLHHGGVPPFDAGAQPEFARGPHHGMGPHPFGGPMSPVGFHGPWGHHGRGRGHHHERPECHPEATAKPESEQEDRNSCSNDKLKLKARHVKDVTIPEGTAVFPGVPFIKTWRVRNVGADWPANARLIFISHKGDQMSGPAFVPIQGPVLAGAETDISVNLVAPQEPGEYTGFWRMSTENGQKFGQRLWVSIKVVANSSSSSDDSGFEHVPAPSEYDQLCKQVEDMGFDVPKRRIEHLLRKFGGNVNVVAEKLAARRDGQKEGRGRRHGCGKH